MNISSPPQKPEAKHQHEYKPVWDIKYNMAWEPLLYMVCACGHLIKSTLSKE